jgi:hypothetical protein
MQSSRYFKVPFIAQIVYGPCMFRLEGKGKVQKILGQAQAKFGDVKQDVNDAVTKTA